MPKPWNEIDWSAERPDEQQVARSRLRLDYAPVDVRGEATLRLLQELRGAYTNGGALLVVVQIEGDDDVCHWFASRNRFDEYGLFDHFLRSRGLREAAPELVAGGVAPWMAEPGRFDESFTGAYTLDGWLARMLMVGGAYGRFGGTAAEAKMLGAAASFEIVADRFDEFVVYENHEPWSGWFGGVAWDTSLLAIDLAQRRLYLLALTDTD